MLASRNTYVEIHFLKRSKHVFLVTEQKLWTFARTSWNTL